MSLTSPDVLRPRQKPTQSSGSAAANEVTGRSAVSNHRRLSQLIARDPYQRAAAASSAPSSTNNMTCLLIYFRRWVMLSGTSITATLISPLELVRQYESRRSPKSRRGSGRRNNLLTWCFFFFGAFQLRWELLVWLYFSFWIANLFEMNFLRAHGVSPSNILSIFRAGCFHSRPLHAFT